MAKAKQVLKNLKRKARKKTVIKIKNKKRN